jgi:hypothetical protein
METFWKLLRTHLNPLWPLSAWLPLFNCYTKSWLASLPSCSINYGILKHRTLSYIPMSLGESLSVPACKVGSRSVDLFRPRIPQRDS